VLDPVAPERIEILGLPSSSFGTSCIVGLNISGLLLPQKGAPQGVIGKRYEQFIYGVIDTLIQKYKVSVLLIPHVFGESGEADTRACEQIYETVNMNYREQIGVLRGTYNQNEIKYVIGLCEFFIGSRMHACIAALSQYIPTVSIAYSDKFTGVMETVCGQHLVADLRRMNVETILSFVAEVFEERSPIRKELQFRIPIAKDAALNMFNRFNDSGTLV
jgi:polysaccharide pyruvyl transferase WcaK-like protein